MKRSVGLTLFNPFALVRWGRAQLHGFRQGKTARDAWQRGGALVVQPGGKVTFRYVSLGPGDHPGSTTLLAALKRTASAPSAPFAKRLCPLLPRIRGGVDFVDPAR